MVHERLHCPRLGESVGVAAVEAAFGGVVDLPSVEAKTAVPHDPPHSHRVRHGGAVLTSPPP